MKKNSHKQQILKRKNFLPTLLLTIVLWGSLAGLVYFIDPAVFAAVLIFFILVFFCLLFTFSLIFANSRRGMVATIAATFFLFLTYIGIGNILNAILIIAIALCIELYFSWK